MRYTLIMIGTDTIDSIVSILVASLHPQKIIIFGSYGRMTATEESDIDILVIKDTAEPRPKRLSNVRPLLRGKAVPMDIIVYSPEEIDEWRDVPGSFVHSVLHSGRVVYGG